MSKGKKSFADQLREWRHSKGWTQEEMAKYLNVSLRTLENWEQGHRQPTGEGAIRRLLEEAK